MRPRTSILAAIATLASLVSLMVPIGPAQAAPCTNPKFVTSDPNGMWSDGNYIVHNNMWNASSYDISETLRACSYRNWSVRVTADNSNGDGAVKTYPNVHLDFHNWETGDEPQLSSFSRIRSSWAARTPGVGIYNAAYDIWLNGVPGEYEVMIWTDNYRQVPAGRRGRQGTALGGCALAAVGHRRQLHPEPRPGSRRLKHGTLPLRSMLSWLVKAGRVPQDATLGQICLRVRGGLHRRAARDVQGQGLLAVGPSIGSNPRGCVVARLSRQYVARIIARHADAVGARGRDRARVPRLDPARPPRRACERLVRQQRHRGRDLPARHPRDVRGRVAARAARRRWRDRLAAPRELAGPDHGRLRVDVRRVRLRDGSRPARRAGDGDLGHPRLAAAVRRVPRHRLRGAGRSPPVPALETGRPAGAALLRADDGCRPDLATAPSTVRGTTSSRGACSRSPSAECSRPSACSA